jgi:hypothetical protein
MKAGRERQGGGERGQALGVVVTAANVNDTIMFQAVVEDIPPIRTTAGRGRTPTCQGAR